MFSKSERPELTSAKIHHFKVAVRWLRRKIPGGHYAGR